jgi:hypothetical protein
VILVVLVATVGAGTAPAAAAKPFLDDDCYNSLSDVFEFLDQWEQLAGDPASRDDLGILGFLKDAGAHGEDTSFEADQLTNHIDLTYAATDEFFDGELRRCERVLTRQKPKRGSPLDDCREALATGSQMMKQEFPAAFGTSKNDFGAIGTFANARAQGEAGDTEFNGVVLPAIDQVNNIRSDFLDLSDSCDERTS